MGRSSCKSGSARALLALLLLVVGLQEVRAAPPSARQLVRQGVGLHNRKRYAEAIQKFQDAYAKDPKLTRVLVLLAASHLNLDHAEEALTYYERYEQEEGSLQPAEREQLTSYYDEVARQFLAGRRRDPGRPELLLFAGVALMRAGQPEPAREQLERYRKEVPDPPEGYRNKLDKYLREYWSWALRERQDRLSRDGQRDLLLLVGEAHLRLDHLEEALDAYDQYREGGVAPGEQVGADGGPLAAGYRDLVERLGRAASPAQRLLLCGRAQFGLGHLDEAERHYGRYQQAEPAPADSYRARLERYQRDLRARRPPAPPPVRVAPVVAVVAPLPPPPPPPAPKRTPVYRRWWFWGALSAVAAAGVVTAAVAGSQRPEPPPEGVEVHDIP